MDALCPQCHGTMQWRDGRFYCERCQREYVREARCPECERPLQELKACGAVDYLCQHGHGLISKKRVIFTYTEI